MDTLRKIDSQQLYKFWEVLALSLAIIIVMFCVTKMLPTLLSPIVSLFCAGLLYQIVKTIRQRTGGCVLLPYVIFLSLIVYSFTSIVINILDAWKIVIFPDEIIFYKHYYIVSLLYIPTAFLTVVVAYIRRKHLKFCIDCKLSRADAMSINRINNIFSSESYFQLRNMMVLFGSLTVIIWGYYLIYFVNININARDNYVFLWLVVIALTIDEVYFIYRYYNLYLDLKERDDIISRDEMEDLTQKTYLRFYVICDNAIYVNPETKELKSKYGEVIDTPFVTRRNMHGISQPEINNIIKVMTGVVGELRFFYGRATSLKDVSLLRYFYFVNPVDGKMPELRTKGEWMDFNKFKKIYSEDAARISDISTLDLTRLATIVIAHKTYDDAGFRRSKIRSYQAHFNISDVYNLDLDYQSDRWIKISLFNSDVPMYRFKRWWRKLIGQSV